MIRRPQVATRTDTLFPYTTLFRSRPADEAASLKLWEKPVLPIGGGVLVKKGLRAGTDVACALQRVEAIWIDGTYPDPARVNALSDEVVATLSREKIGRASCRDRVGQYVYISVGAGPLQKQTTRDRPNEQ